jgi:alpha-1,6-mannosyltransferase
MISSFFESQNKPLALLGWASVVLYFCLFLCLTVFSDSSVRREITMIILWGAYLCYVLGWRLIEQDLNKSVGLILSFAAIFYSIMFFVVPPTESDFYHYYFEDHVWSLDGVNPYAVSPSELPHEVSGQHTHWPNLAAQHGPVRSLIMAPAAWLGGGIFWLSLFWYKTIFLSAVFLLVFCCYRILPFINRSDFSRVSFLLTWNPLILYESMTASGTDALMISLLLASLLFLFDKRIFLSAIFLSASVMTKYITIFCLPLIIWYIYKNLSWIKSLKFLGIFLVSNIIYFIPFWFGLGTLDSLFYVVNYFESNSLIGLLYIYITFLGPNITHQTWQSIVNFIFIFSYLVFLGFVFFRKSFTGKTLIALCVLAIGLFLAIAKVWFYVKYLIWLIPLLIILDKKFDFWVVFLTGMAVFGLVFTGVFTLLLFPPVITLGGYWVAKRHFKLS